MGEVSVSGSQAPLPDGVVLSPPQKKKLKGLFVPVYVRLKGVWLDGE